MINDKKYQKRDNFVPWVKQAALCEYLQMENNELLNKKLVELVTVPSSSMELFLDIFVSNA